MPTVLFLQPQTQAAAAAKFTTAHGARVYDARPVSIPPNDPEDVYMLYLSIRGGGFFRRQYRTKRSGLTATATALDLITRARQGDTKFEVGKDLLSIVWKEACHLFIIIDIPACKFSDKPLDEKHDPLHFHDSKSLPGTNATFYYDKNASFFDGEILPDNVLGVPAFRCINHFTDEDGKPLWHPRLRTYGFEIRYLTAAGLEIVDPDGQNQGPPA